MAVVNQYKFYGVDLATTDETTMFAADDTLPLISETYIIKSLRVTNNTRNTPTITIKNNTFNIVNLQTLTAFLMMLPSPYFCLCGFVIILPKF